MFTFTWNGVTKNWANDADWDQNSIRNAVYQWSLSGSGANEFFLELAGGGNPLVAQEPDNVQENGSNMVNATLGSLAAGEWDYGDNDALGFNTIYVRLSDDADPDTKTFAFVSFTDVPYNLQGVDMGTTGNNVEQGLDQSIVNLLRFTQRKDYTGLIGTEATPLRLNGATDADIGIRLSSVTDPPGSLRTHIDFGSANPSNIRVHGTASSSQDKDFGPTRILTDNAASKIFVLGGNVSIAAKANEVLQAALISVSGGNATIGVPGGEADITLAKLETSGGTVLAFDGATVVEVIGGSLVMQSKAGAAAVNIRVGGFVWKGDEGVTLPAVVMFGGSTDLQQSNAARTITALTIHPGATLLDNPGAVTVGSFVRAPGRPFTLTGI